MPIAQGPERHELRSNGPSPHYRFAADFAEAATTPTQSSFQYTQTVAPAMYSSILAVAQAIVTESEDVPIEFAKVVSEDYWSLI